MARKIDDVFFIKHISFNLETDNLNTFNPKGAAVVTTVFLFLCVRVCVCFYVFYFYFFVFIFFDKKNTATNNKNNHEKTQQF